MDNSKTHRTLTVNNIKSGEFSIGRLESMLLDFKQKLNTYTNTNQRKEQQKRYNSFANAITRLKINRNHKMANNTEKAIPQHVKNAKKKARNEFVASLNPRTRKLRR